MYDFQIKCKIFRQFVITYLLLTFYKDCYVHLQEWFLNLVIKLSKWYNHEAIIKKWLFNEMRYHILNNAPSISHRDLNAF